MDTLAIKWPPFSGQGDIFCVVYTEGVLRGMRVLCCQGLVWVRGKIARKDDIHALLSGCLTYFSLLSKLS
jgi:hypothetical protein